MDVALMQKTDELAAELAQNVTTLEELNTAMRSLMTSTMERMLNTEMDVHLGRRSVPALRPQEDPTATTSEAVIAAVTSKGGNRRNGTSPNRQ